MVASRKRRFGFGWGSWVLAAAFGMVGRVFSLHRLAEFDMSSFSGHTLLFWDGSGCVPKSDVCRVSREAWSRAVQSRARKHAYR